MLVSLLTRRYRSMELTEQWLIDPHAGNLLACPDGRLCYLDFGT